MRTKKVGDKVEAKHRLRRSLGSFDLFLLGIGAVIGTGIFVLTGIAAANQSGPGIVLSFAIAGVVCIFAALAYAELASSVGGAGSAYSYSYATIGELVAWIIGWDLILEYIVSVPAISLGWSGYAQNILQNIGFTLPTYLAKSWYEGDGGFVNLPAMMIILVLMVILNAGSKQGARLNAGIVFIKVLTIAVFIGVALFHIDPNNWVPFMPYGWFGHDASGNPVGIFAGAAIVFFAFLGFDAVSTAAEESKNPQKDMPFGIIGSLLFCTAAYIIVSLLLTGIISYKELAVASPVAFALQKVGVGWAAALISVGALAGITSVMLVMFYGATRLVFAIARDGLLPYGLTSVSQRSGVPSLIITVLGIAIALIAGFFPLQALAELINIGTLAAFVLVCLGVALLRKTHPKLRRPFKSPLGITGSIIGAILCFGLMLALPTITWWRFLLWMLVGLIIYLTYGRFHSRLAVKKSKR
ncbi:MAG: amino acid permease [Alphaproteobacteria bacterium]|nr:amino acid permease [Alphaproteobacteria bacterium]